MNTERLHELISNMNAFEKEAYHKSEILNELLQLQNDIVNLTFNDEHARTANLRFWDVCNHLEKLNTECGNIADYEFEKFSKDCRFLGNLIKAEISGRRGERIVFERLDQLGCGNFVLKNVELSDTNFRTEIDAVIITSSRLILVEVKNSSKDIYIDDRGDYYRTGEYLNWDCNIADKMNCRERMIQSILSEHGVENVEIASIVVFTNKYIEIKNKCKKIRTCFVGQLNSIIEDEEKDEKFSVCEMEKIQSIIVTASEKEKYPFEFDVTQFKTDAAVLIAKLEEAKANMSIGEAEEPDLNLNKEAANESILDGDLQEKANTKLVQYVGATVFSIAVSLILGYAIGYKRYNKSR